MADSVSYVPKACAYITRGDRELLVFEGPEYEGLQVPKGTIEAGESLLTALQREVKEESGLSTLGSVQHLTSDVWMRRCLPPKFYRRHFFHARVDDDRDEWTHVVTGDGDERGAEFECFWLKLPSNREFALALDDYVHLVEEALPRV